MSARARRVSVGIAAQRERHDAAAGQLVVEELELGVVRGVVAVQGAGEVHATRRDLRKSLSSSSGCSHTHPLDAGLATADEPSGPTSSQPARASRRQRTRRVSRDPSHTQPRRSYVVGASERETKI